MNYIVRLLQLFVLMILLIPGAQAQNKGAEAKAAYLLAEEQFNAGNYETCISYLDDASKNLGAANSKILYLKIMSQREIAKKDTSYISRLIATIDSFEKATDVSNFNEEKYLEVVKLKLFVRKQGIEEKTPEELAAARFINYSIDGLKPGMSVDDLKKTKQDYFARATKSTTGDVDTYFLSDSTNMSVVSTKNNIVFSVYKTLFIHEGEDIGFSKGSASINEIKNALGFNFAPVITTTETAGKGATSIITIYEWQLAHKTVTIDFTKNIRKRSNGSFGSITIKDPSVLLPK
jgi:hypothetical protein